MNTAPTVEIVGGEPLLIVTNRAGTSFAVRYVPVGGRYGLRDGVVNDWKPMVEFYDWRYRGADHGERGQFVSRYNLDSLTVAEGLPWDHDWRTGIDLCGHVDAWQLEAQPLQYALVFALALDGARRAAEAVTA